MEFKKDLIKWNKDYSVNVTVFDMHHQKMLHIINDFYSIVINGGQTEKIESILQQLIDYGQYHFTAEEKAFDKFNYPDREEHKAIHRAYSKKILSLQEKLKGNVKEVSITLMDFLEDWWINHINYIDKKYSDFLNHNGMK